MVNILIADNNIDYIQKLVNAITTVDIPVRLYTISTDSDRTLNMLGNNNSICMDFETLVLESKIKTYNNEKLIKSKIKSELKYLGYDLSHKGTIYLIESIYLIIANNKQNDFHDLKADIYPIISTKYRQSLSNIKWNINRANTCMYQVCDSKALKQYFGFFDDIKPKTKTIIYTILDKLQSHI